ncbi:hypothetical protein [Polycladidibacter stylochi]|uniref:hypothetical protein n=1 Tax=Polycladidibacter stylochi TaxID=1807766 RepID=UPI0012E33ED5|nr:hypothetical protein [Pseudovibrio stylochi]
MDKLYKKHMNYIFVVLCVNNFKSALARFYWGGYITAHQPIRARRPSNEDAVHYSVLQFAAVAELVDAQR